MTCSKVKKGSNIFLDFMQAYRSYIALSLLSFHVFECYSQQSAGQDISEDSLRSVYESAIFDAAVVESSEIHSLTPLVQDSVHVVTWTQFAESYSAGESAKLAWGDVWVTEVPEVQKICQTYPASKLELRLRQLLGLPSDSKKTAFVVMKVDRDDIFRPCADPDPTKDDCGNSIPDTESKGHAEWFAKQVLGSYQVPGGFPWTRLGYTYDWNPTTPEFGVSEYVVRKNATVEVISVLSTADYCNCE